MIFFSSIRPVSQAKRDGRVREQHIFRCFLHFVTFFTIFRQQRSFTKRREVQGVRGHMKLESIAAAGDLLYDAIPLNGRMLMVGSLAPEQSPQREMRGSKTRQIVLTERSAFPSSSVQARAAKCSQVKWVNVPPGD